MDQYNAEDDDAGVERKFSPVVLRKKSVELKVGGVVVGQKIGKGKLYKRPEPVGFGFAGSIEKSYFFIGKNQGAAMKQAPVHHPAVFF
jgi:hypothetical protein